MTIEPHYFSAREAQSASEDATGLKSAFMRQVTLDILERVKNEAYKGERHLVIDGTVDQVVIRRLQELGYITNVSSHRNETITEITW